MATRNFYIKTNNKKVFLEGLGVKDEYEAKGKVDYMENNGTVNFTYTEGQGRGMRTSSHYTKLRVKRSHYKRILIYFKKYKKYPVSYTYLT